MSGGNAMTERNCLPAPSDASPDSLPQRATHFLSKAPASTQDIVLRHANLSPRGVSALGPSAAEVAWPMRADRSLAAIANESLALDSGILCFLVDALTSAHVSAWTGHTRHVSASLHVEFVEPVRVEESFVLTSRLLRVGRRVCFICAEVRQRRNGRAVLCARAEHTKIFYEKGGRVLPNELELAQEQRGESDCPTFESFPLHWVRTVFSPQMMSASLRLDAKPWAPRNLPAPQLPPQAQTVGAVSDPNNAPQTSPMAAKLFVGQLPFESDERRLLDLFSAYGNVEHIHVLRDSNNRSKGAAFVTYSKVEEADTAIFTLHNRYKMLSNRMIQVSYAKNSPNISAFGAWSAIAVHQMHPTNPVPDVANVPSEDRLYQGS